MELAGVEHVLTAIAAGSIDIENDSVGVTVGSATKEFDVICSPLCAGSAQPPTSQQWALHIHWLQSLQIHVELHRIARQVGFCEGANCRGNKPPGEAAGPLGCMAVMLPVLRHPPSPHFSFLALFPSYRPILTMDCLKVPPCPDSLITV